MARVRFEKTGAGIERLSSRIEMRGGVPYYQDRRVIGRDTPIMNGVYLGEHAREAVVVHDSAALKELFVAAKARAQLARLTPQEKEDRVLGAVYDTIKAGVRRAEPGEVEAKLRELGVKPDQKVSLDVFLRNGGECRHLNLAIAALLEKFKEEGHLRGRVSVDRNSVEGVGGHAWARYEHSDGEVRVADAMQDFLGKRKHAKNWSYARSGE